MRRFAATSAGALLVLASACGGGSSGPDPLAAAAARTEEAGSARLVSVMRGESKATGQTYVHRRSGLVDYRRGTSMLTQQSTFGGRTREPLRRLQLGSVSYDEAPAELGLPAGKRWLRTDGRQQQTAGLSDPTRLLGYLRGWTEDVSLVSQADIGGVPTTLYRGKLDLRKAVEHDLEARGWSEGAIEQFLGDELEELSSVEGFVGRDGLIRKIVVTSKSAGFRETETVEFSDYGIRVAVEAPPGRAVVDASWLEG